ncbi:MAG TPA: hypothetical protein VM695_01550 [Phycisphaerae bacterium]|nr:hypothetical protein [Phycisphaerae bacterium]
MREALEKKLAAIRLRCGVNVVLVHAAVVLAAAGVVAAAAVAVEKLLAVPLVEVWTTCTFAVVVAAMTAALSLLRVPSRMEVALLMDRRLAFRERISTALALSDSDDPFAQAATREAHRAAERLDVSGRFPVRPSRHWLATVAAWSVAAGVFLFLPEMDLLGYVARQRADQDRAAQLKVAEQEVAQAVSTVKTAVQQINDKQLLAAMEDLAKITEGLKPEEVRREALRKLGKLADSLHEMEKSLANQAGEQMSQMLRDLRGNPNGLNNELNRALASGDFASAARMLRDLLQQANEGKLTEDQKKRLAEQLKDLAEQLKQVADAQKQREKTLQEQGLDAQTAKKLAGMSEQELREALKKQGLSDQQIDEMMKKMAAGQQACQNCQGLSQSMAKCSGERGELKPGEMVGLIEGLQGMESESAERKSIQESLDELEQAVARLGQGGDDGSGLVFDPNMLGDPNAMGLWQAGEGLKPGRGGGGGPGRAFGNRATGGPEDVGHRKTGVQNTPGKGDEEIVASWLFKGPQAKGDSKRKLTGVVQAAKDSAASAIRDNKIPRKYEPAVKKYFGGFEQSVRDANAP